MVKNIAISVSRDPALYASCIRDNPYAFPLERLVIDNRERNEPISVCYNRFLDGYDYSHEAWFMFCHEDFELREDVSPILDRIDRSALHGVVGGARRGIAGFGRQVIYGNMTECRRNGEGEEWQVGRRVEKATEVESFDCCCLMVHSSLIARYGLRFDERLPFDLYVEDFCATAKVKYGIRSFVHPVKCCHHSGSRATGRLYRHLPYLGKKYPHDCFVGTLVYFGTPGWQKRLQDWAVSKWRRQGCAKCVRRFFAGCGREVI